MVTLVIIYPHLFFLEALSALSLYPTQLAESVSGYAACITYSRQSGNLPRLPLPVSEYIFVAYHQYNIRRLGLLSSISFAGLFIRWQSSAMTFRSHSLTSISSQIQRPIKFAPNFLHKQFLKIYSGRSYVRGSISECVEFGIPSNAGKVGVYWTMPCSFFFTSTGTCPTLMYPMMNIAGITGDPSFTW